MTKRLGRLIVWTAMLAVVGGAAASATAPASRILVSDEAVYEVASQLRCVVCQNLSVADSPSEMAGQMRAIIRERLAAGETPEDVRRYFVDKYGEWILLSPRPRGFTLLPWLAAPFAVLVGGSIVAYLVRRWTRRSRSQANAPVVDAAMAERIRREMDAEP